MALKWRLFCPVAVFLLSGLSGVGCTKEEKKFDVFNANEPKVVRAGGTVELKSWDRETNRGLDLHDAFDVSSSNAANVKIVAQCNRGAYYLTNEFNSSKLKVIKIFQLVDQEFLSSDFASTPIYCNFFITLSNDVGSRHIFPIATTPILDSQKAEVRINDELVRFDSMEAGTASGICDDMTTPELFFRQITEFKFFQFDAPVPRTLRTRETILERPLQYCRIGVFQGGQLVAISNRFSKVIPREPLTSTLEVHAPGDFVREDRSTFDSQFFQLVAKEMMRVVYTNTIPVPRRILVPKKKLPAIYEVAAIEKKVSGQVGAKFPVPRDWIYLTVADRGGATVEDDGDNWLVSLEGAGSSFAISMMASGAPGDGCSPIGTRLNSLLIYPNPNHPIKIVEIMSSKEPINEISFNVADKVYITPHQERAVSRSDIESWPTSNGVYCTWPL